MYFHRLSTMRTYVTKSYVKLEVFFRSFFYVACFKRSNKLDRVLRFVSKDCEWFTPDICLTPSSQRETERVSTWTIEQCFNRVSIKLALLSSIALYNSTATKNRARTAKYQRMRNVLRHSILPNFGHGCITLRFVRLASLSVWNVNLFPYKPLIGSLNLT